MSLEGYELIPLNNLDASLIDGGGKVDRHFDGTITIFGFEVYDGEEEKGHRWFWN